MPRKPTHPRSKLAPVTVIAAETGLPYTTLRDIVFRGELAVFKVGRAWYLDRADVAAYIDRTKETIGG